jgi:outer membrane protein
MLKISHLIFYKLALFAVCTVHAQTPSHHLMPDGSRDMYVGLGVIQRPTYEGAIKLKYAPLPVLQIQWSNGIFIGGMNLGMHLSDQPQIEFGPIITLAPGRNESGSDNKIDAVSGINHKNSQSLESKNKTENKLSGLDNLQARILLGGFFNKNLSENLQSTNILSFGAGNDRNGIRLTSDLRYRFTELDQHHSLTVSMGLTYTNQDYTQAYFGISQLEAENNNRREYLNSSGIKDIHTDLNWNWAFNSSYLLTSKININYLMGSAKNSPIVERRSNISISSAIAYRF